MANVIVVKNFLFGVKDESGKIIVPCIFSNVWFEGDLIIIENDKHQFGILDENGKILAKCQYDKINFLDDGYAMVEKNKLFGFVDPMGKEIAPCKYTSVHAFRNGFALVKFDGETMFINTYGREIKLVDNHYEKVRDFSCGRARVCYNRRFGFVDTMGKKVVPCKYVDASDYKEGFSRVLLNNKYGFIDVNGEVVVPLVYDSAKDFNCGLAMVKRQGLWGFVDKTGKEVVPCKYIDVSGFKKGFAFVLSKNGYGFIDVAGQEVISPQYSKVIDISDGMYSVQEFVPINSYHDFVRKGFLNPKLKHSTPCKYDKIRYENGIAMCEMVYGGSKADYYDENYNMYTSENAKKYKHVYKKYKAQICDIIDSAKLEIYKLGNDNSPGAFLIRSEILSRARDSVKILLENRNEELESIQKISTLFTLNERS